MKNLEEVFKSEPRNISSIIKNKELFYIPLYQRDYSWEQSHVKSLLGDITQDMISSRSDSTRITFLGTLLLVNKIGRGSIRGMTAKHRPTSNDYRVVVDGQQRLTTIFLINACLVYKNRIDKRKIEELKNTAGLGETEIALLDEIDEFFIERVYNLITDDDIAFPNNSQNTVPRIARYERDKVQYESGEYSSDIASFLYDINTKIRENKLEYAAFDKFKKETKGKVGYNIHHNLKAILKEVDGLSDIDGAITFTELIQHCNDLSDDAAVELSDHLPDFPPDHELWGILYRCRWSLYFLLRVCATHVTVDNESYAFDMFQALNTTGEPLSAYETFRPNVIEYMHSEQDSGREKETRVCLEEIDSYLFQISDQKKKHEAVEGVLGIYSYVVNGTSVSKRLTDQRRLLKSSFDNAQARANEINALRVLSACSKFQEKIWNQSNTTQVLNELRIEVDNKDYSDALLALDFLRKTKHEICRPLITSIHYICAEGSHRTTLKALKLIAGFNVLRRALTQGTDGIDGVYKSIYKKLSEKSESNQTITAEELLELARSTFYEDLKSKIGKLSGHDSSLLSEAKSHWKDVCVRSLKYKTGVGLNFVRLILIAAYDNKIYKNDALTTAPLGGVESTFTHHYWSKFFDDESPLTIEHIAPQKHAESWQQGIYTDSLVDVIGNLVLLPRSVNSAIGNNSWDNKLREYKRLSDQTEGESFFVGLQYLTHLKVGQWDQKSIISHGELILESAWDRLLAWASLDLSFTDGNEA